MKHTQPFIFLLSSDRSGSNLLLSIMNSHPELCAPPPTHVFPVLTKELEHYGDLTNIKNWTALCNHAYDLMSASFGDLKCFSSFKKNISVPSKQTLAGLIKFIYTREAKEHSKQNILVKAHKAYNYSNFLTANFNEAKYIFLVRDPRDMALSWLNTAGLKGGIMRAASIWAQEQNGFISFTKTLTQTNYINVGYEQILKEPKLTLKLICDFLEIPFSQNLLNHHENISSKKRSSKIKAWENLAKPIMTKNYAKYKTALSTEQIEYIEAICNIPMQKLGYFSELYSEKTDINKLEKHLEPQEPWLKEQYELLPLKEKEAHSLHKQAIEQCRLYHLNNITNT